MSLKRINSQIVRLAGILPTYYTNEQNNTK